MHYKVTFLCSAAKNNEDCNDNNAHRSNIEINKWILMGSELKKKTGKRAFKKESNHTLKTKGERLGWEPLEREKEVPLRTIVGEGNRVNSVCCFMSIDEKTIL